MISARKYYCKSLSTLNLLPSKLLGKFASSFQTIKYGQLHYRDLERLKTKALKINKDNFDKKTSIDSHGKQDIIWWKNNIIGSFSTMRIRSNSFTITTDASTTGWGVAFKNTSTGGQLSIPKNLMHINVLDLKVILFGLRSLCDLVCDSHLKIYSDNTTVVYCINNMESCRSIECYKTFGQFGTGILKGGYGSGCKVSGDRL